MSRALLASLWAVAIVSVVTSCGQTNPIAAPSPNGRATVSPATSASPAPAASPGSMPVAAANALVRSTVSGAQPLLLPASISSSWSALVEELGPAFFDLVYTSPDGKQTIEFAIVVPNPPPPGSNGTQSQPRFHGDIHSIYQVDDDTVATSHRWLMWNEPGTWTMPNGLPGVPYFLVADGFTDAAFWAVANSVK